LFLCYGGEFRALNTSPSYLNKDSALAHEYGRDRLVLMPRDPHWLFAYWEITPASRAKITGSSFLRVKRFNPVGKTLASYFDLALTPETDNWYINAGFANSLYQVDLGWQDPAGNFHPLLSSNFAQTPPDSISPREDEEWRLPGNKGRRLYRRLARSSMSSFEFFLWMREQRQRIYPQ